MTLPNSPEHAFLDLGSETLEIPFVPASEGGAGLAINHLRPKTGYVVYDPGFSSVAPCKSSITYLDGENGILRYRGYPIEQIAEHLSFMEVSYLFIHDALPTKEQLDVFTNMVRDNMMLPENMRKFFDAIPKNAPPMAILSSGIEMMTAYRRREKEPIDDPDFIPSAVYRLLAEAPTIAAWSHKTSVDEPLVYPDGRLDYASNILHMLTWTPINNYEVDPVMARALDVLLILHGDHEQNCSTSTVRMVASSRADLHACISSGINSLWGSLHGGANQAVIEMLQTILDNDRDIGRVLSRARDRNDPFRLMGFGHRVYKTYDPRARIIKQAAHDVLATYMPNDPLLELAMELEEAALQDDYFQSHNLYPNVDFYSGLIYRAMGLPAKMFTVMFAIGRLPGWIAQWREANLDPESRIVRPRQVYVGPAKRDIIPIEERG
ncbi:citrate synthase [Stomatohabitans albus]|uniref:citrate synthase n=1 Tax=Stomatohabitans albus TaxID=3110766 RepID=UPI00300C68D5